jgi:glycosyltransferase involved in cell wall biosynthesis
MVLLEAMAAGLPIVAHNGTGIPCVVDDGKCGYLVDVRDTHLYTQRLLTILRNDEIRYKMGQEGISQASHRFSQGRIAEQLFNVYAEVLSK